MANPGGQNRLKAAFTNPADPTGLAAFLGFLAFRGPNVRVGTSPTGQPIDLPTFGAVLNALEKDGNVDVLSTPHILTTDAGFGVRSNQFGFDISWTSGLSVTVQAATNLSGPTWVSLRTNILAADTLYFADAQWTNYPSRLYRIRSP